MSAGCGDRLGLATPGHVRAFRIAGGGITPFFCQQSMRENTRTGRSPQQVLDDAMWGVFEAGWNGPWGADADHLKTVDDIDLCLAAGYTFFTVDPGDHVDNGAQSACAELLAAKLQALPWKDLDDTESGLRRRYVGRTFECEDVAVVFDEPVLARAAAKYGRAIAHTARLHRHLVDRGQPFELEMSVDETETPTSVAEHVFIVLELKRLGVQLVSLAPRYVGRFEKGVDYIGDLERFERELAQHASIARSLGPYKLSIHSGSDKFSVYPIFARYARGRAHLKTAGTSYLEALRAIALVDPGFFRTLMLFATERYERDRKTYHVSAMVSRVPRLEALANDQLPELLDQFDARQVLHVTFGSVLDRYGSELQAVLASQEEAHYAALEAHFRRHLEPFV